jgi:hypothetical protein
MGIKDSLPNYFGGDNYLFGFNSFCFSSERIVFDAAGLLFSCFLCDSAFCFIHCGRLSQEAKATHPVYSSLLYLTGEPHGGATLVLDQTLDSEVVAKWGWSNTPKNNSFLVFPGNMLHGVLPCTTGTDPDDNLSSSNNGATPKMEDLWAPSASTKSKAGNGAKAAAAEHRLTFMVGFWT